MQSKQDTVCIKCGTRLPAGISFRQVTDDIGNVIGARCYNACRQSAPEPEPERLACGHEARFEILGPGDLKACVACVATQAIELGKQQADDHDRFWAAMGVLSSEISVDQAITKWRAMEAVMKAAKDVTQKGMQPFNALARLEEALKHYDEQPHVEPTEEPS